MNPPSVRTQMAGHPVVSVVLFLVLAFTLYEAYTGQMSWLGPLAVLFVSGGHADAQRRVTEWKRWKLQDELISGTREIRQAETRRKRRDLFTTLVIALYGGLAYVLWHDWPSAAHHLDRYLLLAVGFLLLNVVTVLVIRYRWQKHCRAKQRAIDATKLQIAQIALPLPKQAPHVRKAYSQLPNYAQAMLTTQRTRL